VVTNTIFSLFCRNWEYGVNVTSSVAPVKNEVGCLKQRSRIFFLNDLRPCIEQLVMISKPTNARVSVLKYIRNLVHRSYVSAIHVAILREMH
jgi:hypothetical protein